MDSKPVEQKKIRILALCDSPTAATGFAQVSRNILRGLADTGRYEIDVLGINFYGDFYDRTKHPYNIYPAMPQGWNDMYGRGRLSNALNGGEDKFGLVPPWDLLFTIQDPFIIEGMGLDTPFGEQLRVTADLWKRQLPPELWFKWIAYWPVDADLKENWVTRSITLPHYPVAYCDWGKEQMLKWDKPQHEVRFKLASNVQQEKKWARLTIPNLKDRVSVINHGVDINVFKPVPEEEIKKFRKDFFHGLLADDTFLVVNVSRNQPRKDIPRTLKAFAEFRKMVPNSHLYLHMKEQDAGGSISEMARNFGLIQEQDYSIPADFNAGVGFPIETVNMIYNAADVCVTTTLGEGWGFITTEAMACKTPIIAPNITSILDIFNSYVPEGKDLNVWLEEEGWDKVRGIPARAGSTNSEWVCLGMEDNERIRPLTNVDDLVQKLLWVYKYPERAKKITERAYEWVQELAWDKIVLKWDELFTRAYAELETERRMGDMIDKVGRNDPCPCGSGVKFKRCHGATTHLDKLQSYFVEE